MACPCDSVWADDRFGEFSVPELVGVVRDGEEHVGPIGRARRPAEGWCRKRGQGRSWSVPDLVRGADAVPHGIAARVAGAFLADDHVAPRQEVAIGSWHTRVWFNIEKPARARCQVAVRPYVPVGD